MKFRLAATLVAIALSAGTAAAQRKVVTVESTPTAYELGVDATADIGLGGDSFTDISIPSGSLRMGFPINPNISIEPKARLSILSGGGDTNTSYRAEVGALYHLDATKMQREGLYVRPTVGVTGFSGSGSQNTVFAGVGVGYKKPILAQLGLRFEAAFLRNFNNGGSNELELSAGLSWFTH
ncbi:MAG: hypothetical protein ABIQ55_07500 [Gemmatimonadaceae bacterium]